MKRLALLILAVFAAAAGAADGSHAAAYEASRPERVFSHTVPFAHASTIAEAANGDLLCAFFGGEREKSPNTAIYLAIKKAGSKTWSRPVEIANALGDDGKRFAAWNPVLYAERSGKIHLYYKLGDSPRTWEGFVKYSSDNGKTWSEQIKLGKDLVGPAKNKPVEFRGKLVCPSSREFHSSFGWTSRFEIFDGAKWRVKSVPFSVFFGLIQPALAVQKDGSLRAFMRSRSGKIYTSESKDALSWSFPQAMPIDNPNSGLDAQTLADGNIALVCNPTRKDRSKLSVFISADAQNWSEIYTQNSTHNLSYPSIIQTSDGAIHCVYSDYLGISHITLRKK